MRVKIQRVKTSRNIESKNTESKIIIEAINRNVNEKIQSEILQRVETRILKSSWVKYDIWETKRQSEKIKKNFLDSSPHRQPAEKGEGVRVENVGGIYSAGKYPDFALCVRTQNDFNLKGGITAHPNNKTRLNRFICLYTGHYTRKRNRNTAKNEYLCIILLQTCIFMHKNALNPP